MTISVLSAEEAVGGLGDVLPLFCAASLLVLLDGVKSGFRPQLFSQTRKQTAEQFTDLPRTPVVQENY